MQHHSYWKQSVSDLYSLFKSMQCTHARVIEIITEPDMNSAKQMVFGYLIQFIGSLLPEEL